VLSSLHDEEFSALWLKIRLVTENVLIFVPSGGLPAAMLYKSREGFIS
jgi:hypothetical protein